MKLLFNSLLGPCYWILLNWIILLCVSAEETAKIIEETTTILTKKTINEVISMSTLIGRGNDTSDLPLCLENEYADGVWVLRDDIVDKDFVCCSYDGNDYNFNNAMCGTQSYVWFPYYTGSDTHYTWTGGHGCNCDKRENVYRYSPHVREKYIWQPSKCRLLPWNGKQFCDLLGSRRIMLIGDSTVKQTMATISSMIFEHSGGCARNLMYVESEKLTLTVTSPMPDKLVVDHPYTAFLTAVKTHMPEIIIASIGPHIHSISEYNIFENEFEKRFIPQFYDQKHFPTNRKLLLRGQHEGHINCNHFQKPIYNMDKNGGADPYNWAIIKQFDDRMQSLVNRVRTKFEKSSPTPTPTKRMFYMDTSPFASRPDAHIDHKDCLHYCLPGPLNLEANILLTKLFTGEL